MRWTIVAAVAALALGSVPAFASDSGDLPAPTTFTEIQQMQQPAVGHKVLSPQHSSGSTASYTSQSNNLGTWLFPADTTGGGEN